MSLLTTSVSTWLSCYFPRPKARMRLVCFPHGGGGPQAYQQWSDLIGEEIEIFAVHLPGRGSRLRERPLQDMHSICDAIITSMAKHQDKPYSFFGHSVGALVAYETARKMEELGMMPPLSLFLSAHTAPHLINQGQQMHRFSDEQLLDLVNSFDLVPDGELGNHELAELLLPPMRADFRAAEMYQVPAQPRLSIPLMALGGSNDELISQEDLYAWKEYTSGRFALEMYEGGHFYFLDHLQDILARLHHAMDLQLAALPLSVIHGPRTDYPADKCLHELFVHQAAKTPEKTALVDASGSMTFGQLDQATDLLARYLQQQGVRVDTITGIFMETCLEYVIACIAILKAGGAYMPLETAFPDALLARVLASAEPVLVLTREVWRDRLPISWQESERFFVLDNSWQEKLQEGVLPALNTHAGLPGPDSLAFCVMSSGTTGMPKGIICPHRSAVNSYYWRYTHYPYHQKEREACNVFFVWETLRPLLQGCPAYIIADEVIFDPPRLLDFLERHQISRVLLTPSLLEQVLNTAPPDLASKLPALEIVYVNGEVVTTALVNDFTARLPQVKLINDYSIAECHDVCTCELRNPDSRSRFVPVGPPMDNVRMYVLNDMLHPVPRGMRGEIYVAGDNLARGYLGEPEKTAARFLPDTVQADGSLMYRTGDVGRILANGYLEVQGRVEFMLKLRGFSIVPGAVEAAIAEYPAVSSVAVLPENNPDTGQPDYLVAYVVAETSSSALAAALRQHARERLPHYAVPSVFLFVDALPLHDVTGKLDRQKLPRPDLAMTDEKIGQLEPKNDLEEGIITIWEEILHNKPQSYRDNFFDLGGHSLLAIQLIARISEKIGLKLSVVDVFHYPTLEAFIEYVTEKKASGERKMDAFLDAVTARTKRARKKRDAAEKIAVIGMACRFPGAADVHQYWDNLVNGVRSIRPLTISELEDRGIGREVYERAGYVRFGAFLDDVESFDYRFWGLSRNEAVSMDPQHRLFLECCWHASEDAGYRPEEISEVTAVFGGCFLPGYLVNVLEGGGLTDPADPTGFHLTETGNDKDYFTSRVAYLMGLKGPAVTVQTSCSTSLAAIACACQSLNAGQCDAAFAGASSIILPQGGYHYTEGFINSPDGHVRTFDKDAGGTVLGDGVGAVLLKRHADAVAKGDRILATIKGIGMNNDGNVKAGYASPSVQGQAEVVAQALAAADVLPESIRYIEAHGTGTLIGDPIEVQALTRVFRRTTDKNTFCALGSVKPNIGHSNIAAGMAGLIKTVLSLQHRIIPPTIDYHAPNPEMELEKSPFYINKQAIGWETDTGLPRRAGVSSFGIGGTNVHLILEEADIQGNEEKRPKERPYPATLLPLSAKTTSSLDAARKQLIDFLKKNPECSLRNIGYTLGTGRKHFPRRLAVACSDHASAASALAAWQETEESPAVVDGPIVFMFSGQGSQYTTMAGQLHAGNEIFRQYVDECLAFLRDMMQEDLQALLFMHPEKSADILQKPHILQPALFMVEYGMAMTLIHYGIKPDIVMGHSIGEYAAACVAGIMSLQDALKLVVTRSEAIGAADEGAMLSLKMSMQAAEDCFARWPDVTIAAENSFTDIVLSGTPEAIARAKEECFLQGVSCKQVHVNRPFHSPLLQHGALLLDQQAAAIAFHAPAVRMTSNLTGGFLDDAPLNWRYWGQQMCSRIRFLQNVQSVLRKSPAMMLEVGPGRVLSNLVRRIALHEEFAQMRLPVLPTLPHPLEKERDDNLFLGNTLAAVWQRGIELDWHTLYAGENPERISLPAYCFEKYRCWPARPKPLQQKKEAAEKENRQEYFYIPSWARTVPEPQQAISGSPENNQCWWLYAGDTAVSYQLAELLCRLLTGPGQQLVCILAENQKAVSVQGTSSYFLSSEQDAWPALCQQLLAEGKKPDHILHLASFSLQKENSASFAHYHQWLSFAQAVAELPLKKVQIRTITSQTMQVDQEKTAPLKMSLLGPVMVLSQEHPHLSSRLLDIQLSAREQLFIAARDILRECLQATPDRERFVAIRGRHRWVPRYEQVELAHDVTARSRTTFKAGSVFLVTGGLGRIGRCLARYLAARECSLVLVSRRACSPEQYVNLKKELCMGERGTQLVIEQADVSQEGEMNRILDEAIDRFGRIDGIFHTAGIASLRYLHELDETVSTQEFSGKVMGALAVARAIARQRQKQRQLPGFVVLFSSMASILGGLGMSAYTAANRCLDGLVHNVTMDGIRWLAINWDDWDFAYTCEQTVFYEKTTARHAMSPERGLDILERILAHPYLSQVLVSTRPLQPRIDQWLLEQQGGPPVIEACAVLQPDMQREKTAPGGETGRLQTIITSVYKEVLGVESITAQDNFFDLGGDSLLAARILAGLRQNIPGGESIRLTSIFEYPTVALLTEAVAAQIEQVSQPQPNHESAYLWR